MVDNSYTRAIEKVFRARVRSLCCRCASVVCCLCDVSVYKKKILYTLSVAEFVFKQTNKESLICSVACTCNASFYDTTSTNEEAITVASYRQHGDCDIYRRVV